MKKRGTRKKAGTGSGLLRRVIFLLLSGGLIAVVYPHRGELVAGVRGHLFGREEIIIVQTPEDIPSGKKRSVVAARVVGIPDYDSIIAVPLRDRVFTCFRMTGFQNRLFIVSNTPLKPPDEISEILRERTFQGRLTPAGQGNLGANILRGLEPHRIRVPADAWLLGEGESALPSLARSLGLLACGCLSLFFLFRAIQ